MSTCRLLIIGEAWGKSEKMFEHAFVGASGRELAKMLSEAQLAPPLKNPYASELEMIAHWKALEVSHGIRLANVINDQPEFNDFEAAYCVGKNEAIDFDGKLTLSLKAGKYLGPLTKPHIEALFALVDEVQPNLILALGNKACLATLNQVNISAIRGTLKVSPHLSGNPKVLPTYHPAHILRNWPFRVTAMADLFKAAREIDHRDIRRVPRYILLEPTIDEIDAWLSVRVPRYTADIESGRALFSKAELKHLTLTQHKILNSHISMIGFARDRHNALVIPFMSRSRPGMNFWQDKRDEERVLTRVKNVLEEPSIEKIFQNGMYDISMLLKYGIAPRGCRNDTMLLHHSLYPEMLKGLAYLGSVYEDMPAWKTAYGQGEGLSLKKDD